MTDLAPDTLAKPNAEEANTSKNPYEIVAYSNWTMQYYRLMGTRQVCKACGSKREGAVASEVYIVCAKASRPADVHTISIHNALKRYKDQLGGTLESCRKYLPKLPTRIVWHDLPVDQCPECFTPDQWLRGDESTRLPAMLPAILNLPLATEESSIYSSGNSNSNSKRIKPKNKPTSTQKPLTLQQLIEGL